MSIEQFLDYLRTSPIEEADRFLRQSLIEICDEQKKLCADNIKVSLNYDWVTDVASFTIRRNAELEIPYPQILNE